MSRYSLYSDLHVISQDAIERLPSHWEVKQVRYILMEGAEGIKIGPFGSALKLEDMVDDGVKVYGQENVIKKDFSLGKRRITDFKYKEMMVYKVAAQDILITMMGTSGKCEIVPSNAENGIIDSHLLRVRVQSEVIVPEFFKMLLDESPEIAHQIKVQGKGSIMHGLNSGIVKSLLLPIPPIAEQNKILSFLSEETAKIDTLIEKQQQLIKLLKEKRQAVISHAVTKGLNPNTPMKDSGVEWLGEVPEHWQITRAKFVSKIFVPQRNKPDINDSAGTVWITMENMGQKYIYETEKFISPEAAKAAGSKVLKAHSVIASCVGNFGISSINKVDAIINQQLQAFQPKKIEAEYLQSIVEISKPYFQSIGTAATLIYVNQEGFENLPVLVPPQNEQECICSFVEGKEAKFRDLIGKSKIQIDLLKERRTALISAAVTGKIDVRNWQPADNKNTEKVEVTA